MVCPGPNASDPSQEDNAVNSCSSTVDVSINNSHEQMPSKLEDF